MRVDAAPELSESSAAPPAAPVVNGRRQLLAASAGNLAEWYDWLAYAYLSAYFADQIFPPGGDPVVLALSAFAVFAVGFAARPVGGLLLGVLADRRGRRAAMATTITLMGAGQLAMALLPTYEQIGMASPVLLVVIRLAQGLSVGGESTVSAVFVVESAPATRRGLYSSIGYVSGNLGQLLAAGVAALLTWQLTAGQMHAWGWRLAFGLGAVACLTGLWVRHGTQETYRPGTERTARPRPFDFLRSNPREAALIVGMTLGATVTFYTWTTFLPTYARLVVGFDPGSALAVSTISLAFFTALQPLAGRLSDRVGRKPLLITFGAGFTVLTVPLLGLLRDSFWSMLLISCGGMVLLTGYTAVSGAVMVELFPASVRTAGIGLPYAATVAAAGGTAPYLATALIEKGHADWFGWYVSALTLVSTLVYIGMRETKGVPLQ
ncbi:MFS transporter [Streptomyces sp. MB09-01]|uniref:MFS transporter n=1 Tax=Streptomyces sp. MB09-01 TaxID=3028666 RepID=UPI0029AD7850|nr:MFS transporter [Streptomyces sp. MB09-01]MDX3535882.1 MFS transporter [Streptomyces sp. MB09-01]